MTDPSRLTSQCSGAPQGPLYSPPPPGDPEDRAGPQVPASVPSALGLRRPAWGFLGKRKAAHSTATRASHSTVTGHLYTLSLASRHLPRKYSDGGSEGTPNHTAREDSAQGAAGSCSAAWWGFWRVRCTPGRPFPASTACGAQRPTRACCPGPTSGFPRTELFPGTREARGRQKEHRLFVRRPAPVSPAVTWAPCLCPAPWRRWPSVSRLRARAQGPGAPVTRRRRVGG